LAILISNAFILKKYIPAMFQAAVMEDGRFLD
jgi:hypothetical protein